MGCVAHGDRKSAHLECFLLSIHVPRLKLPFSPLFIWFMRLHIALRQADSTGVSGLKWAMLMGANAVFQKNLTEPSLQACLCSKWIDAYILENRNDCTQVPWNALVPLKGNSSYTSLFGQKNIECRSVHCKDVKISNLVAETGGIVVRRDGPDRLANVN